MTETEGQRLLPVIDHHRKVGQLVTFSDSTEVDSPPQITSIHHNIRLGSPDRAITCFA